MTAEIERVSPETVALIDRERDALVGPAQTAMGRDGGVVKIRGGRHVTDQALTEIAGHLGVSIDSTAPTVTDDPLTGGSPTAMVTTVVCRADGTTVSSTGLCSSGETVNGRRRWSDWHAVCSMAETRSRVRALTVLLKPVIAMADSDVSTTPAELIEPAQSDAQAERRNPGDPEAAHRAAQERGRRREEAMERGKRRNPAKQPKAKADAEPERSAEWTGRRTIIANLKDTIRERGMAGEAIAAAQAAELPVGDEAIDALDVGALDELMDLFTLVLETHSKEES